MTKRITKDGVDIAEALTLEMLYGGNEETVLPSPRKGVVMTAELRQRCILRSSCGHMTPRKVTTRRRPASRSGENAVRLYISLYNLTQVPK